MDIQKKFLTEALTDNCWIKRRGRGNGGCDCQLGKFLIVKKILPDSFVRNV